MPKRSFWTAVGYSAGIATSVAVQRRIKRTVRRYAPAELAASVAAKRDGLVDRARQVTIDLRGAASEGRRAMRESRDDLEREFRPRP